MNIDLVKFCWIIIYKITWWNHIIIILQVEIKVFFIKNVKLIFKIELKRYIAGAKIFDIIIGKFSY